MTHAWFDLTAGVAGDMLLGALLDAGAPLAAVQAAVDAVAPGAVALSAAEVTRAGQRATKLGVEITHADPPHRRWSALREELRAAALHPATRDAALAVFGRLAEAEGRVHGTDADEVHFHEVGALDSIADVVGACEALRLLGVTSVSASGIALGAGRVRAAHGDMPVPVPAVAELMIGWRSVALDRAGERRDGGVEHAAEPSSQHAHAHAHPHEHAHGHGRPQGRAEDHRHDHDRPAPLTTPGELGELATPTGVAFVRALASACEALPSLEVSAVGVGAGGRDTPGRPNVVRVILGEASGRGAQAQASDLMSEIMANVDDFDPRLWPGVIDACLSAGAADAWLTPIVMKKGRPAHTIHALASPGTTDAVAGVLLTHTTTLGVREVLTHRRVLERTFTTVEVLGHTLTVKVGARDGVVVHAAAEFASLAQVAAATGRPEAEIAQRAASAIVSASLAPGDPAPAG